MATTSQIQDLLDRLAALYDLAVSTYSGDILANPALAEQIRQVLAEIRAVQEADLQDRDAPPDGGLTGLIGLGPDPVGSLGDARLVTRIPPYEEAVTAERVRAVADLYYIYQHERLGVFRVATKLQELFRAGTIRLSDGEGAFRLYRYDRRRVLRSSLRDRLQAYRRVFGFTASNPPRGAKVNKDFHSLFVRFVNAVARFYRDKRVSEVVRQRPDDASFGSVAIVRRSGLDLRSNVKSASYGNIAVLRVELSQLLDDTMAILRSDDVRNLFGADDEWDVAEEILTRYLGKRPDISRRTRVASAGKEILRWVSQPFLLRPERQVFEALLLDIGDSCEEWLTSARAIGVTAKGEVA